MHRLHSQHLYESLWSRQKPIVVTQPVRKFWKLCNTIERSTQLLLQLLPQHQLTNQLIQQHSSPKQKKHNSTMYAASPRGCARTYTCVMRCCRRQLHSYYSLARASNQLQMQTLMPLFLGVTFVIMTQCVSLSVGLRKIAAQQLHAV